MKSTRRWFQFSLRSFFVVMTCLAVWLGIIVNRAREQQEAVKAIEALGGSVRYDRQFEAKVESPGRAWLRRLIGDDYFDEVRLVTFDGAPPDEHLDIPASIPYLRRLRGLETVVVPATTLKSVLHELEISLPNCEVYWPEV